MCKGVILMTLKHMLGSFLRKGFGTCDCLRGNAEQEVDGDPSCK